MADLGFFTPTEDNASLIGDAQSGKGISASPLDFQPNATSSTLNETSEAAAKSQSKPKSHKSRPEETASIYAPSFHEASTDALAHLAARYWPIPDLKARPNIDGISSKSVDVDQEAGDHESINQKSHEKAKTKKIRKSSVKQPEAHSQDDRKSDAESKAATQSKWNPDVIKQIWAELVTSKFSRSKVMLLEYLQTLENVR